MKIILFQFYSPDPCPDYDEIGQYFNHRGHDVYVAHMTRDKKLAIRNQKNSSEADIFPWSIKDFRYFNFFARRIAFIVFMLRLRRLIKQMRPDIFMIATSELMYLSLLPVFMSKRIVFIYDVRQLGFTPGNSFLVKLKNIKAKINMWFLSQYIYDYTCFAFIDTAKVILGNNWMNRKAVVMEVGINQLFLQSPCRREKRKGDKLQLVYIGSLARVRKLEFIIDSVAQLIKATKDFHITFIGPDADYFYHYYLGKSNLKEYITLLDPVPYRDIPKVLEKFHVAIAYVPDHPDWRYQPTLKVKEYCALGIPVIASDNMPNRVFVKENETGLFFQNTKDDFCKTILALIDNKVLFDRLIYTSFINRTGKTWDESAGEYEDLFKKLINKV
jgi:glycosyltransferase involved in cell wall biosynthesis